MISYSEHELKLNMQCQRSYVCIISINIDTILYIFETYRISALSVRLRTLDIQLGLPLDDCGHPISMFNIVWS